MGPQRRADEDRLRASSHATSHRGARPPRRAAQNCATSERTSMIAPNQNADAACASIGSSASGGYSNPKSRNGSAPSRRRSA